METWTDDETAFERTAKEELVGEDEEGIDTELGMIDAEDETEYLMPFPEDEASAWLLSSRDLCCPLISVGHHGQEGLRLREGLQRRLTGVPVLTGQRKLPTAACNCGALDKLIVLSERLGIAARSGGAPLPHPSLPDLLPRSTRTHGEEIIQLSGHLRDLLPRTTKTSTVLHQGTIVASGPSRELQGNPKGVVRAVPEVLVWPHPTTP